MNNTELLKYVDKLETKGMAITKQWHDVWGEAMRYFFSQHDLGNMKRHTDWDFIVINYIWPTAIQEIAKLAKNNPKIYASGRSSDDSDAAMIWQGATQWQWESALKMRLNQIAAIFCGKIFGYRVSKVYWENKVSWDDEGKKWVGDVRYKLWHPAHFWADGQEDINDGNCGTVRYVTLEYAQKMWPKFKRELAEIAKNSKDDGDKSFGSVAFKSATKSDGTTVEYDDENIEKIPASKILSLIDGVDEIAENDDTKYVRLSEIYIKDEQETHKKIESDVPPQELIMSGQAVDIGGMLYGTDNMPITPENWPNMVVAEYDEPVYPNGRLVITAGEGDNRIILNPDIEEQKWQFRSWPFVTVPHYLLPFMWQGINAVTLYKSTQDMVNISVSHMINNLKMFGDPVRVVEDDAVALNPKTKKPWAIISAAGAIIRLAKGRISSYKTEPPMPLSPAALQLYELLTQEYRNMTGLQGIGQGVQLKGGTTATEAQTLAISSNDRIFLQSVYEDEWVKQVATLIAEIMQFYYDEGRWVRIVGDDSIAGIQQITSKEKAAQYDIMVEPGATLPFDEEKRILKYEKAYQLLAQPVANPMMPDMLRALGIPNWKKLLDEMPAYKQYLGITKLYKAVTSGQMMPEQATQIIYQEATKLFASQGGNMQQQGVMQAQ